MPCLRSMLRVGYRYSLCVTYLVCFRENAGVSVCVRCPMDKIYTWFVPKCSYISTRTYRYALLLEIDAAKLTLHIILLQRGKTKR